jgi:hypothetical protein
MPQDDWAMRNLQSRVEASERQVDDITRLLSGFTALQFSAFDQSGQPFSWEALARAAGAWPGLPPPPHQFLIQNASSGSTPQITVFPGTITDILNGGHIWSPTLGGLPLNSVPPPVPTLVVSPGDTVAYFKSTIDTTTGYITACEINTGATMPDSTNAIWYRILSDITVTVSGGTAVVTTFDDGVITSRVYQYCGILPVPDGSGYLDGP